MDHLPDVFFGEVLDEEGDELPEIEDDGDDDEELEEIPANVIEIIGFDPLEDDD